jgi:hypothetical protein
MRCCVGTRRGGGGSPMLECAELCFRTVARFFRGRLEKLPGVSADDLLEMEQKRAKFRAHSERPLLAPLTEGSVVAIIPAGCVAAYTTNASGQRVTRVQCCHATAAHCSHPGELCFQRGRARVVVVVVVGRLVLSSFSCFRRLCFVRATGASTHCIVVPALGGRCLHSISTPVRERQPPSGSLSHRDVLAHKLEGAAGAGSGIGFGMHGSPSLARNRSRSLPRLQCSGPTTRPTKLSPRCTFINGWGLAGYQ